MHNLTHNGLVFNGQSEDVLCKACSQDLREKLGATIQQLIDIVDELEGDCDVERTTGPLDEEYDASELDCSDQYCQ